MLPRFGYGRAEHRFPGHLTVEPGAMRLTANGNSFWPYGACFPKPYWPPVGIFSLPLTSHPDTRGVVDDGHIEAGAPRHDLLPRRERKFETTTPAVGPRAPSRLPRMAFGLYSCGTDATTIATIFPLFSLRSGRFPVARSQLSATSLVETSGPSIGSSPMWGHT